MSRICRACSTANDSDATACVTCGEELPIDRIEATPETALRLEPLTETEAHLDPPAEAPAAAPFSAPTPTYVPTFTPSLLDDPRHLEGISGWLLLVGLIVIAAPIVLIVTIVTSYAPMFLNPDLWNMLQDRPHLHALVTAEAATNAVCFLIAVTLVYLFFAKKKMFPSLMIFYLVLHAVFFIADLAFTYIVAPNTTFRAQDFGATGRSVLLAAILIPYLAMSRRVKATFVN